MPKPNDDNAPSKPVAPDSIEAARQVIRFQQFETVHVWDKAGVYRGGGNGGADNATIPVDPSETLGGTLLHNHPSGGVVSPKDVLAIRDYQPRVFEVVTPTHLYRLTAPDTGWPANMVSEYGKWFQTYRDRLTKNVASGKINQQEYEAEVILRSLRRFVVSLALDYEEIEL